MRHARLVSSLIILCILFREFYSIESAESHRKFRSKGALLKNALRQVKVILIVSEYYSFRVSIKFNKSTQLLIIINTTIFTIYLQGESFIALYQYF